MRHAHEAQHIQSGPDPGEMPSGIGLVRFNVHCAGNASAVLDRMREVLGVVTAQSGVGWPTLDEWRSRLPSWFVAMCAPEMSREEADAWLLRWQVLPPDERRQGEDDRAWSLADWLYWFEPPNRSWYWWDATVESDKLARVALSVSEWPFPWGSVKWLARASGATAIEPESDSEV